MADDKNKQPDWLAPVGSSQPYSGGTPATGGPSWLSAKPGETQFEQQNPVPSPEDQQAREFLLGAASGMSGLPETLNPVSDMLKGAARPPTGADMVGEAALGPLYNIGKQLYGAGKQIISPSGQGDDAMTERAHGMGTLAGTALPMAIGDAVPEVPGAVRGAARAVAPAAPAVGAGLGYEAAGWPGLIVGREIGKGVRTLMKGGSEAAPQAVRNTPFPEPSIPPAPTGAALPDVLTVPEPRAPMTGENPNNMASVPREALPAMAQRGQPGAAQQLQNLGKPTLFTPSGTGYPPPRSTTVFSSKGGGVSPPTDLSIQPKTTPDATVLPEQVKPDFTDKAVHPWQSEARVQNKVNDIQSGEPATIVARPNPDGTVSPVKGHQTPIAAARTGQPVNIVDAGPMTDGEKAATTAESHFFPQNDHAVPASLAKDAATERASLPEEIKQQPALPAKEGPDVKKIQSGTTFQTTKIPDRLRKR